MRNIIPNGQRERTLSNIIVAAASIGMLAILYYFGNIWSAFQVILHAVTPFLLGFALTFVQLPVVRHAEHFLSTCIFRRKPRQRLCRVLGCVFSLLLFAAIIAAFLTILLPQLSASMKQLISMGSQYINENIHLLDEFIQRYELTFLTVDGQQINIAWERLVGEYNSYINTALNLVETFSTSIYQSALNLFVGVITSFYLLLDKEHLCAQAKRICYALLKQDTCETLIYWTRRAGSIFLGFISGKLLDSLIIGLLCYFVMLVLRLEYALLISVIIGFTNILPFFGPFIGAVPSILILLIVNPAHALIFLVFILVLQQLDGNIIGPLIMKDYVGISPLWIMFSIVVGGSLFGFLGMLLSVPLFSLFYAVMQTIVETRLKRKKLRTDLSYYENGPVPERKKDEA